MSDLKKGSEGDPGKTVVPKFDMAGNPEGRMADLFEDTAEQAREEQGLPDPTGDEEGTPGEEATPSDEGEAAAAEEGAPGEEEAGEEAPSEEEQPKEKADLSKEELERRKIQGLYDKTKQELKLATDLIVQSQPLIREVEELRKFRAEVEPVLPKVRIMKDVDEAIEHVDVPEDERTGEEDEHGVRQATDEDKFRVLSKTRDGFIKLVSTSVRRELDAAEKARAGRVVMFQKLTKELVDIEPDIVASGASHQIEVSFSPEEKARVLDPSVSVEEKRDLYVGRYHAMKRKGLLKAREDGGTETLSEKDVQKEVEAQRAREKKAALLRSQGKIGQPGRQDTPTVTDEEKKIMGDMDKFVQTRMKKSPLL